MPMSQGSISRESWKLLVTFNSHHGVNLSQMARLEGTHVVAMQTLEFATREEADEAYALLSEHSMQGRIIEALYK